jgi:hypothetical protein
MDPTRRSQASRTRYTHRPSRARENDSSTRPRLSAPQHRHLPELPGGAECIFSQAKLWENIRELIAPHRDQGEILFVLTIQALRRLDWRRPLTEMANIFEHETMLADVNEAPPPAQLR